ncbi:MAG: hypothetical protein IT235_05470 [Bacteroidia bacterium]|nr:hypothetical protein [Bacteroidia bacterium]
MDNIACTNCGSGNWVSSKYCKQCGYELPQAKDETVEGRVQPSTSTQHRKKRIIGSIVGIIAFWLAYWGVQQLFFKPPSFDKVMMQAASELNKTCPLMVDSETRLDNAVALPDNAFQYNYTLVNITKAEVSIDTIKKYVEPIIINNVKTNPDMKIYRDKKVTMIYYYKDKNGEFAHKFSVTPEMYQ